MPKKRAAAARRDETLNLRVPGELKDALRHAAEADGRTVSNLAVLIMREWLASHGKE